jgi:hypothetical protein
MGAASPWSPIWSPLRDIDCRLMADDCDDGQRAEGTKESMECLMPARVTDGRDGDDHHPIPSRTRHTMCLSRRRRAHTWRRVVASRLVLTRPQTLPWVR